MKRLGNDARTRLPGTQAGQALLILLALLTVIMVAASVTAARGTQQSTSFRAAQTQAALKAAKQALANYAAGVALTCSSSGCVRPGELPCPDLMNNGLANAAGCANPAQRVGRLPWKTLGLPDLRDGSGERLWYAVSSSFVNNPRTGYAVSSNVVTDPSTACITPNASGCLNSNSSGTITVRDQLGTVVNNGTQPSAAVAVVMSPGSTLTRLDGTAQDRSCTGDSNVPLCLSKGICSSGPTTPLCNPINYLDISPSPLSEDNANFTDSSNTDGFITGPISDASNAVQLNDVVMAVNYEDIMPLVQRRVAQEVLRCLNNYANAPAGTYPSDEIYHPGGYGFGRYPWAADPAASITASPYLDKVGQRFGRVPDTGHFDLTYWSSGPLFTGGQISNTMAVWWTPDCAMGGGYGGAPATWWMNWKDVVFYAVAQGYEPDAPTPACTGSNCLTVSPPSAANDKRVVVLVAGRKIPGLGQLRSTAAQQGSPSNYLEDTNLTGGTSYQASQTSSTFNDVVVYQ
jgi:hypothetical protein